MFQTLHGIITKYKYFIKMKHEYPATIYYDNTF